MDHGIRDPGQLGDDVRDPVSWVHQLGERGDNDAVLEDGGGDLDDAVLTGTHAGGLEVDDGNRRQCASSSSSHRVVYRSKQPFSGLAKRMHLSTLARLT